MEQEDEQVLRRRLDSRKIAQARRALNAQKVESVISELSTMFTDMAQLVEEQGELVNIIDDNLNESSKDIQAGQSELLKYYRNLNKEQQFILKIFAVIISLGVLIILIN